MATEKRKKRKHSTEEEDKVEREEAKAPKASRLTDQSSEEGSRRRRSSSRSREKSSDDEERVKEKLEAEHPWRNLQLISSLQNKNVSLHKKVELAYKYVKVSEEGDDGFEGLETISISRVVVFLNNWVQSLFISSEKKIRAEDYKPLSDVIGSVLDTRCWEIFKYCLEESLKLHESLSFPRDFLRVIHCVVKDISSSLSSLSQQPNERIQLVTLCISLVFSSHDGILNENLDLWISTIMAVLELVQMILDQNLEVSEVGVHSLQLACAMLEPFAKFLKIHSNRKNGFRDFVDKLLEPFLNLLGALDTRSHDRDQGLTSNLLKLTDEVLSHGLFHPAHIDGLLCLQSTGRYITSENVKPVDLKISIKSYHRHLFDKLEKLSAGKNVLALNGVGEMFHLFANCVKRQKGIQGRGSLGNLGTEYSVDMYSHASEIDKVVDAHDSRSLNVETRKSLFDFFIQIMEPMLQKLSHYLEVELELGPDLVDLLKTLSSSNKLISSFLNEKLYLRTEDISEGAFFNFLKRIYDTMLSLHVKVVQVWLSRNDHNKTLVTETLNSIAKEFLCAIGYLIEIEYEIVGDNLESLWFVMLSFGALGLSLPQAPVRSSVYTHIIHLGCQLVNLYSELRQVTTTIFTLCKVMRSLISPEDLRKPTNLKLETGAPFLHCKAYVESVHMVLCSQEVRLTIYNAVVSIPEGQVSGCIQQLRTDILESLDWIKDNGPAAAPSNLGELSPSTNKLCFDMQAELFGRGLCDVYTLVMDSLTVTAGNSNLIRVSTEEMMKALRLKMNNLVDEQKDGIGEFLSTVTGRTQSDCGSICTRWVLLFFFRLYISCRNLYRQALSLAPIDTSRKMSIEMGDSITAYSGKDWLERTDWNYGGFFSWILYSSASLITVIQSISDIYPVGNAADCSPLVYVLNAMAIQRLVDLNRLIKSFEYRLQRDEYLVQTKLVDDSTKTIRKSIKKCQKCISSLRQEAADLTNFILGHLMPLSVKQTSVSSSVDAISIGLDAHPLSEYDAWKFSISAISEKSLPLALWWMICQNIDVWCSHAAKEKLKLFSSLLIQNFLRRDGTTFGDCALQEAANASYLENDVAHEMALELLGDTVFYEQRFLRRHMVSSFFRILEKSVLALFSNVGEVVLKSSPDWTEFLAVLEKSPQISGKNLVMDNSISIKKSASLSSRKQSRECGKEQKPSISQSLAFSECIALFNLLCWMPKGCLSSKSFSQRATCIINTERLILDGILDCQDAAYQKNFHELLRLFLSCRRAIKNLTMVCYEEKMGSSKSSFAAILFQSSDPILWLLNSLSAVIGAQQAYFYDSGTQVKNMVFSLIDHTSYVFLTISKYQFIHAWDTSHDVKPSFLSTENVDGLNPVILIAETLKEQMDLIFSRRKVHSDGLGGSELNNLSAYVSCSQAFWRGFAAALEQIDSGICNIKTEISRWKHGWRVKLMHCIDAFAECVNYYIRALFVEVTEYDDQCCPFLDGCDGSSIVEETFHNDSGDIAEIKQYNTGTLRNCSTSSVNRDQSEKKVRKKKLQSLNAELRNNAFSRCDSFDLSRLKKSVIQGFVRGENPEAAFFLRQLFLASSVLLKLNFQISSASLSLDSVPIFIGISQILLVEMGNKVDVSSPVSLVWVDGVTKFLEELACHFALVDPVLSRNVYVKVIDLHFIAIGKCIMCQGKRASLASHDTESSTKMLDREIELSESTRSCGAYYFDECKARWRMSFRAFVKKPTELHLEAAMLALERSLVGLWTGSTINYTICLGSSGGGTVSSIVAAGIDCMDLVLECVTGRKQLNIVKTRIQSLVACLFNIILHLQGPRIFLKNIVPNKESPDPDSGSVILMCVEVLIRVFGKHGIYHLESFQVGQSLRTPGAIFQNILQLRCSNQGDKLSEGVNICDVDRRFLVDLFAACCRLLSTVIKHYKSETERCVALLEDSVSTLLHCLELVNTDALIKKQNFAWKLQEAVKCAAFLRRIYEELRQQKDVFGQHCSLFLSRYIWTYSGYGPAKVGIQRELDEALRPGVYALIDACSADDLQRLHTIFGEGPCRSTLANLQHDYKLNFQYEGKV